MRNERLQATNSTLEPFISLVETEVAISNISIKTLMLVTRHCINNCILGEPFAYYASIIAQHTLSRRCIVTIISEDRSRNVIMQAITSIAKNIDNNLVKEEEGKELIA